MDKKFTPFAENIRSLALHQQISINAWCLQYPGTGIDQSTVSRILRGTQDASLEMVNRVAEATGFAPWQLLHPDFDPSREPPMLDADVMRVAYVFASIKDAVNRRRARAILEQFEEGYGLAQPRAEPNHAPAEGTETPAEETPPALPSKRTR
jgi:transcriptional regulator with XRE-family HTH domain